jgi:hypothetical protein
MLYCFGFYCFSNNNNFTIITNNNKHSKVTNKVTNIVTKHSNKNANNNNNKPYQPNNNDTGAGLGTEEESRGER